MSEHGYEPVIVENDWYDGPRSGVAIVGGIASYFQCIHGYSHPDETVDIFQVWPASDQAVAWEREQWAIYADWNEQCEAGIVTAATHPGHGGINERYDQLESLLAPHRTPPPEARRFHAEWRFLQPGRRNRDGAGYEGLWSPVPAAQ